MSCVLNRQRASGSGAQGGGSFIVENSLRFDGASRLTKTFAANGDSTTTCTISTWVKKCEFGAVNTIFDAGGYEELRMHQGTYTDCFEIYHVGSSDVLRTASKYRDPTAWYHVVLVFDNTNATTADRMRLIVNGVRVTAIANETQPDLNTVFLRLLLASHVHSIGSISTGGEYLEGYLAEFILLDGTASTDASEFAEYDSNGNWVPKEITIATDTGPVAIGQGVGTAIGNMTAGGNLAAAFDGNIAQASAAAAALGSGSPGYIGKNWGSTKSITKVVVFPSTGSGFASGTETITVKLLGHTSNAPGSATELHTLDIADSNTNAAVVFTPGTLTAFQYHWVSIQAASQGDAYVGELIFYEDGIPGFGTNGFYLDFSVAPGTGFGAGTDVSGSLSLDIIDDTQTYTTNSATYGAAANAADGNAGTHWSTNNSTTPDWWSVDLGDGNAKAVIRVEFDFRSDANQDSIQIYGGNTDDGGGPIDEEATQLATAARSYSNNQTQALEFSNTVAYRYYWIYFNGTANGTASAKDVRMYTAGDFGLNHFTEASLAAADQMSDSPTDSAADDIGNYCTLNPIHPAGGGVLTNGNLEFTGAADNHQVGTMPFPTTGKFYFECEQLTNNGSVGICSESVVASGDTSDGGGTNIVDNIGGDGEAYVLYSSDSKTYSSDGAVAYGNASLSVPTTLGVAVDLDNGAIYFADDNTWIDGDGTDNSATVKSEIEAGTTDSAAYTGLSGVYFPFHQAFNTTNNIINFGANGFEFTPPTGFKPLHTGNLPAPAIKDPSAHFAVKLYEGTGASQDIIFGNNTSMNPDLVWIKNRDAADHGHAVDSVRGATKRLPMIAGDTTAIERTDGNGLDDFSVTDGFGLGSGASVAGYNDNNESFVSYSWKANGSGSSNTDGSINTTKTSANQTAGFSIVTYTGTGANATVGHGLGVAPEVIWIKELSDTTGEWHEYNSHNNTSDPATDYRETLEGNTFTDDATFWQDTAPSSTVFSLGNNTKINGDTNTYVAYCWASIPGYSKMGIYTGTAAANGTYVHCGFRPAFIIPIGIANANTYISDHKRNGYNPENKSSLLDGNNVELSTQVVDILSNGFKWRMDSISNDGTYTFMAFAEAPFGGSGVSQARAR